MSETSRLYGCAAPVMKDLAATADVLLEITAWTGRGIGWAVHPAGVTPKKPVWETAGVLRRGDAIALHEVPLRDPNHPAYWSDAEVTYEVARGVQEMTMMVLWQRGLEPTWPACPAHPDGHPLWPQDCSSGLMTHDGKPFAGPDRGAQWVCPRRSFAVPIGQLARHHRAPQ